MVNKWMGGFYGKKNTSQRTLKDKVDVTLHISLNQS